jgi:hypothetical protein
MRSVASTPTLTLAALGGLDILGHGRMLPRLASNAVKTETLVL